MTNKRQTALKNEGRRKMGIKTNSAINRKKKIEEKYYKLIRLKNISQKERKD